MLLLNPLRNLNRAIFRFNNFRSIAIPCFNTSKIFFSSKPKSSSIFSTPVFESTLFKDYVEKSVKLYKSNQDSVDSEMLNLLNSHKLLLFMEGSVDVPKSLCASNIVKMFTLLQVSNFHAVDVLVNPEVFGFLCSKFNGPVRNVLFKDGVPFAGHDELLELFRAGKLLQALGVPKASSKGVPKEFANHLPVANF